MSQIIYAIIVNSGHVGVCLDAIRLLSSPSARRFSHVTVIGPLDDPLEQSKLDAYNLSLSKNSILLSGTGNFFGPMQNTVFFSCKASLLQQVWWKRDYPGEFNPHVTIYDGDDRNFADRLHTVISRYSYSVLCGEDRLTMFEIGNGKNGFLANQIREELLPRELDLPRQFGSKVHCLSEADRLILIDRICGYLSHIS